MGNFYRSSNEPCRNCYEITNKGSFKNTILIVKFNYADCCKNKSFFNNLYKNHFKKIIFYSDDTNGYKDPDINYINTHKGFFTHKIFYHFYEKYKHLLNDIDGLFYTMDDNIINTNILHNFTTDKIIFYHNKVDNILNYKGWQWDIYKDNINVLINNNLNIKEFSGWFSDFFYLPKKYLTKNTFEEFAKYYVFLELAIPSVINSIEKDELQYQLFLDKVLWDKDREKFLDKTYLKMFKV
jgi:hypothetical protein